MDNDAPVKVLQISDTHLSRTHAYFQDNWLVLLDAIRAEAPSFVFHSGDISFNGPASDDDIAYARSEMDRIAAPWRAIAGNHDIGEAPEFSRLRQPLDDTRIARWRRSFRDLWWFHDIGQWRIIGLDTALMASGRPEEAAQNAFLGEALASRGDRHAMVVVHMPPFGSDPASQAFTTSHIAYPARGSFLDACVEGGVKVIACGHLHIYNRTEYRGIEIVWAPTTAMISVQRHLGDHGRIPKPGYLVWELDRHGARHRFVQPEMMFMLDTTSWSTPNGGTTTTLPPRPLRPPYDPR